VPTNLSQGIYACTVAIGETRYAGALHYGPRPVFKDTLSCEVHLLDVKDVTLSPSAMLRTGSDEGAGTITIDVLERIRDVRDFGSTQELMEEIARDIESARGILRAHGYTQSQEGRP
jgi:FAD synthase